MAYKQLWRVEQLFRTMKSILETRPIYHKCDETIRGHVFCSFPAIVMKCELERRLKEKEQRWEWAESIRGINSLLEVEVEFQGKRFNLRSESVGDAHKAFLAAGVAMPPTVRQLH